MRGGKNIRKALFLQRIQDVLIYTSRIWQWTLKTLGVNCSVLEEKWTRYKNVRYGYH